MTDEQRELWGEVGDPDPPTEEGPRSRRAAGVGRLALDESGSPDA